MSFSFKISESKKLKAIITALSKIVTETEFTVTPSSFSIHAMDPSRISLVRLVIERENFLEYVCDSERKIVVNLVDLDKILKRAGARESLLISFDERTEKIKVIMQQESGRIRTFSLATITNSDFEIFSLDHLINAEWSAEWFMEPEAFLEALKDGEIYSEILSIRTIEDQGLRFSSVGQIGEMEYHINASDLISSYLRKNGKSSYSITFLNAIMNVASIAERMKISLTSDHPLKINFVLEGGGEILFFLAPRVEENNYDEDDE